MVPKTPFTMFPKATAGLFGPNLVRIAIKGSSNERVLRMLKARGNGETPTLFPASDSVTKM